MIGLIPLNNGSKVQTVRDFFKMLLESDLIEALYLALELEDGTVLPALVTDPAYLNQANPYAPVMPINGARAISALTQKNAPTKLAVVLRPCEIRALIELVKLKQASLEDIILIGLDCSGTFEVQDFIAIREDGRFSLETYLTAVASGESPANQKLRQACQMCVHPEPEHADFHILTYGVSMDDGIYVQVRDDLADKFPMSPAYEYQEQSRTNVLKTVLANRQRVRDAEIEAVTQKLSSNGTLAMMFAKCLRCHNCSTACPLCYCKTCLFRTSAFDHQPEHYLNAAYHKGATRLMGDVLLFHLTRLYHMSASCVSCGMCTSACPVDIPVGSIFSAIGTRVQAAFDYLPGRDVNDPLPLTSFQIDEWNEIGEAK